MKNRFVKAIFVLILLTICIGILYIVFLGFIENEVAATVNDEKIYLKDIEKVYNKYNIYSVDNQNQKQGNLPITRKKILDNAINEILVLQEAKKRGIVVSELGVNDRIKDLKAHFPEIYEKVLSEVGLSEYKSILTKRITYQKMKDAVLKESGEDFKISDEEAFKWYLKRKGLSEDADITIKDAREFEKTKDEIKHFIKKEEEEKIFRSWVSGLRRKAKIRIYLQDS